MNLSMWLDVLVSNERAGPKLQKGVLSSKFRCLETVFFLRNSVCTTADLNFSELVSLSLSASANCLKHLLCALLRGATYIQFRKVLISEIVLRV